MDLKEKLEILSDAAKYDVSCSSSGSHRSSQKGTLGSTSYSGICHSFTPDGRCVSLLKILLTNYCIYDCAYCLNKRSNTIARAAFTVDEVVSLTINFYRRNYIEGLFLSSGILKSATHTMECLTRIVKKLRIEEGFKGYIHLKAIPGASEELIHEAGLYVDRMSVNVELPSEASLKLLAPEKKKETIFKPMHTIHQHHLAALDDKKKSKKAPLYVPGGQSTQLIIGATPDTDYNILHLSQKLYQKYGLKRVYYSAYTPVNTGKHLPTLLHPPTLREHRLYQGDWLLRCYGFKVEELLDSQNPYFDTLLDPKTSWALHHLDHFPVEINTASYHTLLRVPGIGIRGAQKIISSRRIGPLRFDDLRKLGIVLKRAQYFITCHTKYYGAVPIQEDKIRKMLVPSHFLEEEIAPYTQLSLFTDSKASSSSKLLMPKSQTHVSSLILPQQSISLTDTSTALSGEL